MPIRLPSLLPAMATRLTPAMVLRWGKWDGDRDSLMLHWPKEALLSPRRTAGTGENAPMHPNRQTTYPDPLDPLDSLEQIASADRPSLIAYLESWGFQCHDHESVHELREAARENFITEQKD